MLEVKTGAVRALVGSPDYAERRAGQVNGAIAPRAAGSTLKPFAYALALDRGLVTPATRLADVPARFRDFDPRNFSLDFRGSVSVRDVPSLLKPSASSVDTICMYGRLAIPSHSLLSDCARSRVRESL